VTRTDMMMKYESMTNSYAKYIQFFTCSGSMPGIGLGSGK